MTDAFYGSIMKKIYSTDDKVMAGHIHSILEDNGIRNWIKNLDLAGAAGELPPIECWPEIWIFNDDEFGEATHLVHSIIAPLPKHGPDWNCECGEILEGQYTSCWKCGRDNPATDDLIS